VGVGSAALLRVVPVDPARSMKKLNDVRALLLM
jgi:hypothetical protein